MATRANFENRVQERQDRAKLRQEAYDKLTPAEKLSKLDEIGLVARKVRAKLTGFKVVAGHMTSFNPYAQALYEGPSEPGQPPVVVQATKSKKRK